MPHPFQHFPLWSSCKGFMKGAAERVAMKEIGIAAAVSPPLSDCSWTMPAMGGEHLLMEDGSPTPWGCQQICLACIPVMGRVGGEHLTSLKLPAGNNLLTTGK